MGRHFGALVRARWERGLHVCVGLDTDLENKKFPESNRLGNLEESIVTHNTGIIRATHDLVCAYKPNLAFYLKVVALAIKAGRPEWIGQSLFALKRTIDRIHEIDSEVPVILDFKPGDIGNTMGGYRDFAMALLVDAVTVNPYLGEVDSVDQFLGNEDLGVFVLARTSSKGSAEFQNLWIQSDREHLNRHWTQTRLYEYVAGRVMSWQMGAKATLGLVVGATAPEELSAIRELVGDEMFLLIPAVGAQGGSASESARRGKKNFIINNSRGAIFASAGPDFAEASRAEVVKMNNEIQPELRA